MATRKAHVENGRGVIDEPMDLADGTVLRIVAGADCDDLDDLDDLNGLSLPPPCP